MSPGRGNYAKTGRSIPTPFKQVDAEVDRMIAKRKARNENESKAKSDSTAVDNKLKGAGFGKDMAGTMGNKKANETRASLKGQITYSIDKDKSTGKYKKNYNTSPAKQVDKEVEAMIAKKKASESKAKTEKARSGGEAMRKKLEQAVKDKTMAETRKKASADSTAVDKKMRLAGFTGNTPGEMGNKKAEETRKAGSAYRNIYESVKKDQSTGKYKMGIGSKNETPAKMKKSPMKQGLNFSTEEELVKAGVKPYKGSNRQKAKETPKPLKSSPAKQLGRQAVTKMGGKKSPAKMGYGTPAKMKKC